MLCTTPPQSVSKNMTWTSVWMRGASSDIGEPAPYVRDPKQIRIKKIPTEGKRQREVRWIRNSERGTSGVEKSHNAACKIVSRNPSTGVGTTITLSLVIRNSSLLPLPGLQNAGPVRIEFQNSR